MNTEIPKFDYAVLTDDSVQWFAYLYAKGKCIDLHSISGNNEFLSNIYERGHSFHQFRPTCGNTSCPSFSVILISQKEAERIQRMIDLSPNYLEYLRLAAYKV